MEISLPPEIEGAILSKHLPLELSREVAYAIHEVLAKIPHAPTRRLVAGDLERVLENGVSEINILPALQAYFKSLSDDIFVG